MNIRRFITSVVLGIAATAGAWAVNAWPGLHTVTQADGTVLSYRVVGDERFHTFATTDGFLIVPDANGQLCYARKAVKGMLETSGVAAHDIAQRSESENKELKAWGVSDFGSVYEAHTSGARKTMMRLPGESFPTKGNLKGVILLVEFSDNSMQEGHDSELFHNLMNEQGCTRENATGSARDYFVDQSNGQFTPDFDVFGPIKL